MTLNGSQFLSNIIHGHRLNPVVPNHILPASSILLTPAHDPKLLPTIRPLNPVANIAVKLIFIFQNRPSPHNTRLLLPRLHLLLLLLLTHRRATFILHLHILPYLVHFRPNSGIFYWEILVTNDRALLCLHHYVCTGELEVAHNVDVVVVELGDLVLQLLGLVHAAVLGRDYGAPRRHTLQRVHSPRQLHSSMRYSRPNHLLYHRHPRSLAHQLDGAVLGTLRKVLLHFLLALLQEGCERIEELTLYILTKLLPRHILFQILLIHQTLDI